jgi:hypothetical protein
MTEDLDHISDEALEQYAMQTLPESACGTLEEHLLVCSECQGRLDQTERYIRAMRSSAMRIRRQNGGEPVL